MTSSTAADARPSEWAIVVGATGAMGRAIVTRLVGCGLRVLAVARDGQRLADLTANSSTVTACEADISDDAAIATVAAAIDGPVRVVVHGPGVPTAGGVLEAPTSALTEAMNIKVCGMLRVVRAVDAHLVTGSRLVAIGGHYGFEPSAYAATAGVANAAISNLIRQLSWAYGPRGITTHLLAPGPADTERLRRVAQARADREGCSLEVVLTTLQAESAIGAFTSVDQIAWAIETLLAPEADALAGSTLFMDAGRRRGLP